MAGIYIHIPFCEQKCIYCDFYSVAPKESPARYAFLIDGFLSSLHREIELRAQEGRFSNAYDTVFLGGGTPSLLSASQIGRILDGLSARFSIKPDAEITLETNPGTVDIQKLRDFRKAGINRISFGVQSFDDDELKFLTRIHNAAVAKDNIRNSFRAGFENVSLDLIFALPGQTVERWRSNLQQAMELSPTHISCYSLIVEPNTPLYRMVESRQVSPLPVDVDAAMYECTVDFLSANGFEQYEVSNFAKPGFRSRHNNGYWNHTPYLGFGPSAHSFWASKRWWNVANVVEYSQRLERGTVPVAGEENLTLEQLMEEEILLGLRSGGIDAGSFHVRYNKDLRTDFASAIETLVQNNLARFQGERFQLTSKGYLLCDEICHSFLRP
jgi:oxygen-independent coproporphyrinogen-3 oxidase